MAYEENLKTAFRYIEDHLKTRIKTGSVARASAYSLFHFHRIFQAATGMTLNTYIRKRQLTEAARDLVNTGEKIIDIALAYGFESQEAFTRAFCRLFRITPGRFRRDRMHYPSVYQNAYNDFHSKGGKMTPEIRETKRIPIVGMRYFGDNAGNEIPDLWHEFFKRVKGIKAANPAGHYYGVCNCPEGSASQNGAAGSEFEYVAGVPVNADTEIPEGMVSREIPGGRYAVFTHRGPLSNLQETYTRIYKEWAGKGEYDIAGSHDFEFYNENFDFQGSGESELYIFVPVR